jgi:hypothetical protein
LKIALLQQNELDYVQIFEKTGWRVYPLADVLATPDEFMALGRR